MKIAHVEVSKVIPSLVSSQLSKNVPKMVAGNSPKSDLLKNLPKENDGRLNKIESLHLQSIESWTDQEQQSVKDLITEYQHLFALNLDELGKTSLVQHDIKLDGVISSKEQYRRITPHQYEQVKKHLQGMLETGAIRRSISPWASPVVLV